MDSDVRLKREEPLRQLLVMNHSLKKELWVFCDHFCFSFSHVVPQFILYLAWPHFFRPIPVEPGKSA